MSTIVINYNDLRDCSDRADKVLDELKSYSDEIDDLVNQLSIDTVSNYDSDGYISGALSAARQKARIAETRADYYSKFSKSLDNLSKTAKECDKLAASGIDNIFDAYIGKRSFLQKVGDALYSSYINFLDKVAGFGPIGEAVSKFLKNMTEGIDAALRKAYNWFKYGNGKYVLNIVKSVIDGLCAVALVVGAVTAAVFTGPVWLAVVGVVGIVAASVYCIQQIADTGRTIAENSKSLGYAYAGKLTEARYYGEIKGYESYTSHYDFGSKEDNERMDLFGKIWGSTKTTSKTVASICTVVSGFSKFGVTENVNGDKVVDFKRAFAGYKEQTLQNMGFHSNDYQDGGFDFGKSTDVTGKIFGDKNHNILSKLGGDNKTGVKILSGLGDLLDHSKSAGTVWNTVNAFQDLFGKGSSSLSTFETVDKIMDVGGNVPFIDSFTSDIWKLAKPVWKSLAS